jgi:UDP-glucose 4-epimerase
MTIMVTGGAGYIGSHTCVELIQSGHSVVIYDNFANSHEEVINRIAGISGVVPAVVRGDVRDQNALLNALRAHRCNSVIHFAGLKSVAESVADPAMYYDTNVAGTLTLIKAMQRADVRKLVFSSSATVYGEPDALPLKEDHPLVPFSPYGRTKKVVEEFLHDVAASTSPIRTAILRYFNPVGSHESGLIGEDPHGAPNNLMPFVSQVAVGRRPFLNVFGNDYDTPDGTGIRDYVHVMDLAAGHLRALESLETHDFITANLGTGRGSSVLELVHAFAEASGMEIPVRFAPRRDGDIASYYASPDLAQRVLGWEAKRDLQEMCRDAWRWQKQNPNGYQAQARRALRQQTARPELAQQFAMSIARIPFRMP